jgi:hypothetical protein
MVWDYFFNIYKIKKKRYYNYLFEVHVRARVWSIFNNEIKSNYNNLCVHTSSGAQKLRAYVSQAHTE